MAWIHTVSDEDATGLCAEVYENIRNSGKVLGIVPNILRSLSLRPEVMEAVDHVGSLVGFGGSGLTRQEEEMICTVVSSINHCHY